MGKKLVQQCAVSHENYSQSQIFCDWLYLEVICFDSNQHQTPLNLIFLTIFITLRAFLVLTLSLSNYIRKIGQNLPYFITTFPIFSLRSQFGSISISSLVQDFFQKDKVNSSLNITVLTSLASNKDKKCKRNFSRQSFS